MRKHRIALAVGLAFPLALPLAASAQDSPSEKSNADAPVKSLGVVTVSSGQPTSLPTQIPTTMEGITREQIEQTVNATDAEDALKYFPSLLVRKRYIGDYNHAILSSRASGTGNSARSAVYADGVLLSNYLGNGVSGLSFPPRWGMVTPEEIERVDVMYGPFSAAYPGNSVGAVVDYVTRMPTQFEGHAGLTYSSQPLSLYNTSGTFNAWQASASVGNKAGDWSWFVNVNHTDSHGQPLTYTTRLLTQTAGAGGTVVSGAVSGLNSAGVPWYILGTGTEYDTKQDHLKIKLAYDITPTVRASYVLGAWVNDSVGTPRTYLRDAAGNAVYSGVVNINGQNYTLAAGDFSSTREKLEHYLHGFSVKSHTQGEWDWEVAASLYDYAKDQKRQSTTAFPGAATGGAGTLADGAGTGWNNLAFKGTWRPAGLKGAHIVDFGVQRDDYALRYVTYNVANWINGSPTSVRSNVSGDSVTWAGWAQDTWAFAKDWKAVLGLRAEHWQTAGATFISGTTVNTQYPSRSESHLSPKAALSYQWQADTVLKASLGRAVRFPSVGELYGATSTTNAQYINDPNLRPEKSWTAELSAEKDLGNALLRLTYFAEDTRDALYSQTIFDSTAGVNVSRVQNVGRVATQGLELAYNGTDVFMRGLDLQASATYTDSIIKSNAGFVTTPGDTVGKRQPNIPMWRATTVATWRVDDRWSLSLGARYSGKQYRTLNNSDVNGFAYMGVSKYFTTDLRVRYKVNKTTVASFGIDNLNNYQYWNFHNYPQRSYSAQIKFDL
jgi:iron complex outermembrane receptor protein